MTGRKVQTYTPVCNHPGPRRKVGINEVAGKEVKEIDEKTGELDVSLDRQQDEVDS